MSLLPEQTDQDANNSLPEHQSELVQDDTPQETEDGFGQLWRKRYAVSLAGSDLSPEAVITLWRERYGEFWPDGNTFYDAFRRLQPGELVESELEMPAGTSLSTGVIVVEVTPTSFTFQTPPGHIFAGTINFAATIESEGLQAAIDIVFRASDPIFELGLPLGGHRREDQFWADTLTNLATALGVHNPAVVNNRTLLDADRKWSNATNIVHNGLIRTQIAKLRDLPETLRGKDKSSTSQDAEPRSAVVIGGGPNGLAAAITLAEAGHSVRVLEANDTIGGGCRTAELTLPGFLHDICSAVHPLAMASPFFRDLDLTKLGVEWINPPVALAHPFDDGTAVTLVRSVEDTAAGLGNDESAWLDMMTPLLKDADGLLDQLLGPFRLPRHPIALARFGMMGLQPAKYFARHRFEDERTRALFAGLAAHSILPLEAPATAAFGLVLGLTGHLVGWPIPRGGSQQIVNAMQAHLESLGGVVELGHRVTSLDSIPDADAVLFDTSPRQFLEITGDAVSGGYRRQLEHYRYGAGVFKVDWALSGPVPWTAEIAHQAGTLHLGGTLAEIARAEAAVGRGSHPDKPFVLVSQPSRFDPTRAPEGQHTLWGYCHVPNGSTVDMTARIEAQIERFAPGFRDLIIGRSTMGPSDLEAHNANYIGGDINAGMQDLRQLFTRPAVRTDPYSTPDPRLFFCSASTPPGGGVHGMCGYHAAKSVLRRQS